MGLGTGVEGIIKGKLRLVNNILVRKQPNKVNRSMNLSVGKEKRLFYCWILDRKPKTRLILRDASAESLRSVKK